MRHSLSLAGWLVVALLVAACATTRSAEGGPEIVTEVEVENNLVPRRAVMVRLLSGTGIGDRLGEVSPRRTRTFDLGEQYAGRSYRLAAETPEGQRIVSQSFTVLPGTIVHWDLQANTIATGG